MNKKSIITLMLILSLTIPAFAEDIYQADIQMNEWYNDTNVRTGTWTPQDLTLFTNNSYSALFGTRTGDIVVKFIRGVNQETGYFTVTGVGIENPGVTLREIEDARIIREIKDSSGNTTNIVKIQLINIKTIPITNTSTEGTASTNPVYAYVYVDRELPMTKDKVYNFDGQEYLQQTGWTADGGISQINVYFQRKDTALPMSISVKAESVEPKVSWGEKVAKYIIESNGKYTFTVKYETKNVWGWKEEFTEVYTLAVSGLEVKGASAKTITSTTPYEAVVSTPKTIRMTAEGSFEPQNSVTITNNGDRTHTFKFDTAGAYEFNFKGKDGGQATVSFNVVSLSTQSSQAGTPTTANQQQTGDGDDGGNLLYYLLLIIAVIALGYMFLSRRKGAQKYTLHAKAQ